MLFTAATPMPSFQYWDLTSLTQQWLNGAAANYGVILLADNENQIAHDLRFHSADSTPNSVNQPVLEVVWTQQQRSVYYLKDHLGSVRASVDDNGQLLSRDDYDPWGLQLAGRSMTVQPNLPNKFTGKEWDEDFGLNVYHIGARRYDPEIGRWWSVDALADYSPARSPYHYTSNNPINRIDILGLTDIKIVVQRKIETTKSTIGNIVVTNSGDDRKVTGFSLELPDKDNKKNISRIKAGKYPAKRETSKKFGNVLRLDDKNGRTDILMHPGNTPDDTKGCIVCGTTKSKDMVGKSKKKLKEIINYVDDIIRADKKKSEKTTIIVEVKDPEKKENKNE